MEKIRLFFSDQRRVIIAAAIAAGVLMLAIAILIIALVGGASPDNRNDNSSNNGSQSDAADPDTAGRNFNDGAVSGLSGKVTSLRNLKGLTIRINQIETCNPKVVSAYVAVSTDAGVVNTNFSKKDVKIYLDGKELSQFEFNPVDANKTPISNMLVIDHSGSMSGAPMENAKSAASSYIQKLRPADQVGVIQFDDRVEQLIGITSDKAAAAGVISGIQPRGDTAIYDALYQGIDAVPDCGRKAVTVLTDGDDTASKTQNPTSVITRANKENLPVFSVGIKGEGFNPSTIRSISEATGGQYLEANTPAEISQLYANIDGQLTGQFVANLSLSIPKDGKEHVLKIVSNVEGSPTSSERRFVY